MDEKISKKDIFNALFQQRLKTLRKEMKLTQSDLANKLKIARTSISSYENGDRYPDPKNMKKLCDFFGVDKDYLAGFSEHRTPPSLKNYLKDTKFNLSAVSELTGLTVNQIINIQNDVLEPDPEDNYSFLGDRLYSGIIDLMANVDQDLLAHLVNIIYTKNPLVIKLLKEYMESLEALLNESCHFDILDNTTSGSEEE